MIFTSPTHAPLVLVHAPLVLVHAPLVLVHAPLVLVGMKKSFKYANLRCL
jgi:hypothetical protein